MTPPLLPLKRPWWALVIAVMLVSGFQVEQAKINLNDYLWTLETHPEWEAAGPAERAAIWAERPARVVNHYEITEPWAVFHTMSLREIVALKWALGIGSVLLFFGLDALFLRAAGRWELRRALTGVYALVGVLVLGTAALDGGYDVARELLGFLQSPLPSFLLVFARWALEAVPRG